MADRAPTAAGRPARRPALTQSVITVAAVATTCATLVWTALFYNAVQKHSDAATATAPAAQVAPSGGAAQRTTSVAPVTTRTS